MTAAAGPAVEARGALWRHRGGRGVGPVDLAVARGETLGLMGRNGAGKTTLLRLLASVARPQRGEVRWSSDPDPGRARRGLGVALDRADEEESLSGRQAAHFWCRQWVADRERAARLVDAALERFGLDAVADEPVGAYSFGMRRRLALVEALAHRPALALLDEPTAGLDPEGAAVLGAELGRRGDAGQATVVASNDPEFVERACDRVGFLSDGLLLHCATPARLREAAGRGVRVAELSLVGPGDDAAIAAVAGVERVLRATDGLEVRFSGDGVISALVAAADRPTGRLRALRLRDADLRDAFRSLVGDRLETAP